MNVLVAEDDRVSALVLRRTLERMGHQPTVTSDGEEAWKAFTTGEYQLVISDWMMPGMDGLDLCRKIRESGADSYTYVVLLTAKAQREDRLNALDAGVDDFLPKPLNQADLAARLKTAQRILAWERQLRDVNETLLRNSMLLAVQAAELDKMREEAEFLATHDVLTGVLSRRAWFSAATSSKPNGVAIFDVDFFKRVNDAYGHPAGDQVLIAVATQLASSLGPTSLVGRVGGEEFGALIYDESFEAAVMRCEEAVEGIAQHAVKLRDGRSVEVSVSAGLATWRSGKLLREDSLARTYEAADRLLYEAKRTGRGKLVSDWQVAA